MKFLLMSLSLLLLLPSLVSAEGLSTSPAPDGARVYIISPLDGAEVAGKFTVRFGLQGMGVAPAGFDKANTGHHHLLVDGQQLPAADQAMGGDVMHFGGGQTEKTIELPAGKHTLQLVLGNYQHIPHKPPVMSEKISITVK